jgi:hypothetical protein
MLQATHIKREIDIYQILEYLILCIFINIL